MTHLSRSFEVAPAAALAAGVLAGFAATPAAANAEPVSGCNVPAALQKIEDHILDPAHPPMVQTVLVPRQPDRYLKVFAKGRDGFENLSGFLLGQWRGRGLANLPGLRLRVRRAKPDRPRLRN